VSTNADLVVFSDYVVYIVRNNGRYYALDAATGAIKSNWPYTSASGDATSGPWIDITNSRVIFGTTGGNLDAFASP
jgi:outer membrane protein assembly factor BamB